MLRELWKPGPEKKRPKYNRGKENKVLNLIKLNYITPQRLHSLSNKHNLFESFLRKTKKSWQKCYVFCRCCSYFSRNKLFCETLKLFHSPPVIFVFMVKLKSHEFWKWFKLETVEKKIHQTISHFEWKEKFLSFLEAIFYLISLQSKTFLTATRRKQSHKTSKTVVHRREKFISLLNSKWQATRCVYWNKCFSHPTKKTFISFDIEFIVLSSLIRFNWIIFLPCLFSSRLFPSYIFIIQLLIVASRRWTKLIYACSYNISHLLYLVATP